MKKILLLILFLFSIKLSAQEFGMRIDNGAIESEEIVEASGIAASTKNPGVFWTHNDSGGESRVFAFDSLGRDLGSFYLAGIQNRDWEDIAVGPGPIEGEQYIYIGDIGDNSIRYDNKYIYRVVEPYVSIERTPVDSTLYDVDRLVYQYPDGNRNAETLMLDPLTLNIYIVSKESDTKMYRAAWPYTFHSEPTFDVDTLELTNEFTFSTAVAGDISPDGREVLIKKYNVLYYWPRDESQTIEDALADTLTKVPYLLEPQGEAVCWASDLSGYYTLSEGSHPHLYFYPRLSPTNVKNEKINLDSYSLDQNYPNPFNPTTKISYSIPNQSHVSLKVFDVLGREVAELVNKEQPSGSYKVNFDASLLTSGIYFYRLGSGNIIESKKMILIK